MLSLASSIAGDIDIWPPNGLAPYLLEACCCAVRLDHDHSLCDLRSKVVLFAPLYIS
jgi:hypothetical protein